MSLLFVQEKTFIVLCCNIIDITELSIVSNAILKLLQI